MAKRKGKQSEKYKAHIKSAEFYHHYSIMHFKGHDKKRNRVLIDRDSAFYVDYSTYCKVIDSFNKQLRDEILYNSFDFNMPYRLGLLGIRKKKLTPWINKEGELVNPLPIDWKATMDLWEVDEEAKRLKKRVRHYNEHTKGFIAQWYYSTTKATYQWKSAYSFIPCRTAKLDLSKILKDEDSKIDYYLL
tara:strand:+ start:7685 stop:8251 length:567 start_codon:yes stop_codon:yes gene_type:complete